jgi:hypothetical protein
LWPVITNIIDSGERNVTDDITELRALLKATSKAQPAQADLAKLKAALAAVPKLADVLGNLAEQAELQILQNAVPNDIGFALAVSKRCEVQRNELGYEDASPIERSLIEHVCLCWLRLYVCELRYETNTKSSQTLAQGAYWEKKLSSHQRRYLRSVESLARVRRLLKEPKSPVLNMLLAQQINNRG